MLNTKKSTLLKNFELYQEQKYQENPYKNLLEQIPKGEGLLYNVNGIKTIIQETIPKPRSQSILSSNVKRTIITNLSMATL